ncbi:MAG: Anaerobic sulfatase-maturating enzyme [bacterium ADurb.Bin429]|nr:MAG: Anaerobic sulfatase-maturating enzyme [bacterium ADurb.Bin429]
MIKPAGPACNLACEYCFYREKEALYPEAHFRMTEEALERVIAAFLAAHPDGEVTFGWQGGEPTLMGVAFFRKAVALQRRYARPGQQVSNAFQTNGILLNDEWGRFLAEEHFLVGISIDGPADVHDAYRRDLGGGPCHAKVMKGLEILQRHGVEYNALATVNRKSADHPLRVYRFLTEAGIEHIQFIPIVERETPGKSKVTSFTVRAEQYGAFLCEVFDYWARHDVGRVFVQLFESALNVWLGGPASLCVFATTCGLGLAVEHNGDLYACDHFVYPEYLRGAITSENLASLVDGADQRAFGQAKANLPGECRRCQVRAFCGGDCPKHRLKAGEGGQPISHLCEAYRRFFTHSAAILRAMAVEIRAGRPAANVMQYLRELEGT